MKEKIEAKLFEHAERILKKETLTVEEMNFIIFLLNRIEMKENSESMRKEKEVSDKLWREKMANIIDMAGGV